MHMGIGNIRDRFPAPWLNLKTAVASPTSSAGRRVHSRISKSVRVARRWVPVSAPLVLGCATVSIGTALFVLPHLLLTSTASSTSVPRRPTSGAGASPPAACLVRVRVRVKGEGERVKGEGEGEGECECEGEG